MEFVCCHCNDPGKDEPLRRCAVCHKYFCEQHTHNHSGRPFCSRGCAQYFFFAEPDD
jgi:hypothetical protein